MPDHAVINPQTTVVCDALSQVVPTNALVAVLSARQRVENYGEIVAWQGHNIDTLCTHFKQYRNAYTDRNAHWAVVVDMMDKQPIGKGYNQLFKDHHVTVIALSSLKSVLKDNRFTVRVPDDYVVIEDDSPPPPPPSWWAFWK